MTTVSAMTAFSAPGAGPVTASRCGPRGGARGSAGRTSNNLFGGEPKVKAQVFACTGLGFPIAGQYALRLDPAKNVVLGE